VVGDWVVDRPTGIRRHVYDESYPGSYRDVGGPEYSRVHDIGELWCAVLMSLGRRLGRWECLQVVVDALKLTTANPSLLAARDAILLAAAQHRRGRGDAEPAVAAFVQSAWEVFARYGMGPGARTDGARLAGIVADFTAPPSPSSSSLTGRATPGLPIPDDDPTGVVSTITLPDAGPVVALSVGLEVKHSFRGDLVVRLAAPDGRTAVLHNRTGGRAQDLQTTWTDADSVALRGLRGGASGGAWTLRVSNEAAADVGELVSWSLAAEVGQQRPSVALEAGHPAALSAGPAPEISVPLVCDLSGAVTAVRLELDLSQEDVGDLSVALRGPTGKRVTVHRRRAGGPSGGPSSGGPSGGSPDRLVADYGSAVGEPLAGFVGLEAHGTWTLLIADGERHDAGKLNRCRLTCTT
jgi:extracellular elastinolytic metalloproteinase